MQPIQRQKEWQKNLFCFALLAGFLLLLYFPALNYPFLEDWDDGNFIVLNQRLAFSCENLQYYLMEPFQDLYTPLPMISFMIDRALFGLDPLFFRLHNLLLHFAGGAFLFLIARRLGVNIHFALAAAALWAANPQKVESVVWITERKDVLCGALALAAVYFFLRSVKAKRIPILAGVLSILAIFAKPAAIPLPGVMIVGLFCLYGNRMSRKEYTRLLWFPVAASLAAILWAAWVTAKTNTGVTETNLLIPLHNLFWYPLTALIPYSLNPIYPTIRSLNDILPSVGGGVALLALYIGVARCFRWPWRRIACILLLVVGCTAPVLGMLHYTDFHYCDRYNYLVSAAVWLGVALLLDTCARRRRHWARPLKCGLLALGMIFFFLTWRYLPYWEQSEMVYAYSMEQDRMPNLKTLGNMVYTAYRSNNAERLNDVGERLKKFHREYGVTEAQAENMIRFFRGHTALMSEHVPEALDAYRELVPILEQEGGEQQFLWNSTLQLLFRDLALLALVEQQPERAIRYLEREQAVRPESDVQYYFAEAMKAQLRGNPAAVLAAWETIVLMEPANEEYRKHLEKLQLQVRIP